MSGGGKPPKQNPRLRREDLSEPSQRRQPSGFGMKKFEIDRPELLRRKAEKRGHGSDLQEWERPTCYSTDKVLIKNGVYHIDCLMCSLEDECLEDAATA